MGGVKHIAKIGGASLLVLSLGLMPALAASSQQQKAAERQRRVEIVSFGSIGSFTPAVADPRLAAEFARRGLRSESFRFTPSSPAQSKNRAVRVAVRARTANQVQAARAAAEPAAAPVTAITPVAYNLGVAVGWKRFALSGDLAKIEGGAIPGVREAAEVGVSYSGKRFTGRVQVGASDADGAQARLVDPEKSYSLDVGGSYSIARNLDVTGGVRYRIDRNRLEPLEDQRRDSQAVYVGTAFRF